MSDARGQASILIGGYGVITRGMISNLPSDRFRIALQSRHLRRTPDSKIELVDASAMSGISPDLIVGCFESDERSREFWNSSEIVHLLAKKPICIEMSTLSETAAGEWHALVSKFGAFAVECPVTGGQAGADDGNLSAFLYSDGTPDHLAQFLSSVASRVYRFSEPCAPTRFKLMYNSWNALLLLSVQVYGEKLEELFGADLAVAEDILFNDPNAWMSRVVNAKWHDVMMGGAPSTTFAIEHMVKDLTHAGVFFDPPQELHSETLKAFHRAMRSRGRSVDFTSLRPVEKIALDQAGHAQRGAL